jgi:hypothetical protein
MKDFREFKANIVAKIQEKVAQRLQSRKIEIASTLFNEGWNRPEGKLAGWIAMFQGKKIEIRKEKDAKDIWSAKQFAIKALRVPKSKQGLLAIEPAYEEDMKESTDISEGMEAFKAAAEVLKGFGGKMPKSPVDLVKFDDEIEKASKKYKVSVDDIIKVITK